MANTFVLGSSTLGAQFIPALQYAAPAVFIIKKIFYNTYSFQNKPN